MDINTSQISSQYLDPSDTRWQRYVTSKPEATIFHHPAWLKVLQESYGFRPKIIVTYDTNNKIVAGLPTMEVRGILRGRRLVSLPFTDYCSPLYDSQVALNQLTDALVVLYKTGGVHEIQVRWALPSHAAIRSHSSYCLHTLNLYSDSEKVLRGFKRTHRQNIRTAEERGVVIKWGTESEYLRKFYEMQLETRRRKGVPVQPWKFFDMLGKEILNQGLGFILLAYKDTQCLAGGLFLHWQQTLTYKYAASIGEEQQYRPNNLLTWAAMHWGCENGFTTFDFGRSELGNEGLRRFKRGWGAAETPLLYSSLSASLPADGNGKLVSLMGKVIQKAPLWLCKLTGEMLYRYFG